MDYFDENKTFFKVNSIVKKIKVNLITSIVYQIVTIFYGFILPRLIISNFGTDVHGLTQSIKQFLGLINFLDLGVGQVVRSALYKPLAEQDFNKISRVMVAGKRYYKSMAYMLLGYIGILFVIYPLIVEQNFSWLFIVSLLAVMSVGSFMQYFIGIINEQLLHADQLSYLIYGVNIVCIIVNLLLCLLLISLNCPIQVIMLSTTIVFLAKPLFSVFYIRKHYRIDSKMPYEKDAIPQKWYGMAQHFSAVILDGTDNVVLTFFSSLSNVSVYSVYYMVIGSIHGFYQSVANGIQSAVGAVWVKQKNDEIKKMFLSAEFYLHSTTVFLFSCVGILIVPFVKVYTNDLAYDIYIQPLFAFIFVLAYGIRCLRTPYNIWILAAGHFKQTQHCHIIAAALNLLISIIMVWQYGLIGVAIGTLIAMCYQTFWMAVYTAKKLVRENMANMIKRFAVDFVMVTVIYVLTRHITLAKVSYLGWIMMSIQVTAIAAVCVVAISFVFYRKDCVDVVRKMARKVLLRS